MKTKIIVASTVGLLGIASIVLGATTFAANTATCKGMGYGSGTKMMGNHQGMMKQFTNTGDAEAFRTAVETARENNDYKAFVAAHTKYGVENVATQDEFTAMIEKKANQEKIQTALEAGDYTTRETLNAGRPILDVIDTEAEFKRLQEMHSYNEKARTIREELGIAQQRGEGMGMGKGRGMGMGKGMHSQTNQ